MIGRGLEPRIVRLEALRARPNEMLVVWRRPDGDVFEALKGVTFAHGDKVICAEWFDNSPLPPLTWQKDRPRFEMDRRQYDQIERSVDRAVQWSKAKREAAGFAPMPKITKTRARAMTDADLIHAVLGVRTRQL